MGIKDINVRAGQEFTIRVPYKGHPPPTASWTLDDEAVSDAPRVTKEVKILTFFFFKFRSDLMYYIEWLLQIKNNIK